MSRSFQPLVSFGFIHRSPAGLGFGFSARCIVTGLALGAMATAVRADVEWRQHRLLLEPPAGAREAVGVFEFVNRGTKPVRVADVQSGCGCTVAALEQEDVPPGGTGRVRATYHVGDRVGKQSVSVTVTTHEPDVRTHELTLEVAIKEFVTMTPRLLYWRVGEEVQPKVMRVALGSGFQWLGVECSSTDFSVSSEIADGEVHVKVTPRDLWAKRAAVLKLKVAQPGQAPLEVTASVRVF